MIRFLVSVILIGFVDITFGATTPSQNKAFTLNECGKYPEYQKWGIYNNAKNNFSVIYSIKTNSTCIQYPTQRNAGQVPYTANCNYAKNGAKNQYNAFQLITSTNNYTQFNVFSSNNCLQSIDNVSYSLIDINSCNTSNNYQKWIIDYPLKNYIASFINKSLCITSTFYEYNNCSMSPFIGYDYCNEQLPAMTRVNSLLSMMRISEKIQMLTTKNLNIGVPRLGLKPLIYDEALHGVCAHECAPIFNNNTGCATSFPHALLLASTFNRSLWKEIGKKVSTEARAFYNQGITGLFYFAPNINLFRDPRWGRGQEVGGEDPFLIGQYVQEYSYNMQYGEDTRYLKIVSTAKHYADYDQEGTYGTERGSFNANVTQQDQVEYYWPQWRNAIENGKIHGIMCSYNEVNSIPSCGNNYFINQVARNQWGFNGYVVSDGGAIGNPNWNRYINENYNGSNLMRVNLALQSGCDTNDGSSYLRWIQESYNARIVTEKQLNINAARILLKAFELGIMDNNPGPYYNTYKYDKIDTPQHRQLSLSAAKQGIVLLKNRNNILPFNKSDFKNKKFAFIGPHFNATQAMLSNYHGKNVLVNSHSPYQAALNMNISVTYSVGCDIICNSTDGFNEAIKTAQNADYAIVFLGLYPSRGYDKASEAEVCDRDSLLFPNYQLQLLQNISLLTSTPTILILIHGGPIDLIWPKTNNSIHAIIDAMYPGQLGGDAILSILFGEISPAAKLVETVYPESFCSKRNIMDMSLSNNGGITYRYYTGNDIIYPFGFGLSYTNFTYKWQNSSNIINEILSIQRKIEINMNNIDFVVTVTNIGPMDSDCVILGFIKNENNNSTISGSPNIKLFDFQRVFIRNGQSVNVTLSITPYTISYVNRFGQEIIYSDTYNIFIGEYMNNNKNYVKATLKLIGKSQIISDLFQTNIIHTKSYQIG